MPTYCDLHIHSCLSPCAQDEMTPWNLVGMAKVKGLDVIALTDHNAALNVPEAMRAAETYGVQLIPGMEVTTREEVHMLAYFETVQADLAFAEAVYAHLPDIHNRTDLFGNQWIIGAEDQPTGQLEKLLLNATDLSLSELDNLVTAHGGLLVPAHINRGANSMIVSLGWMPPLPQYPVVEVYSRLPCPPDAVANRHVLHSSDAHRLEDIAERDFTLDVAEPTAAAVFDQLRRWIAEGGTPLAD